MLRRDGVAAVWIKYALEKDLLLRLLLFDPNLELFVRFSFSLETQRHHKNLNIDVSIVKTECWSAKYSPAQTSAWHRPRANDTAHSPVNLFKALGCSGSPRKLIFFEQIRPLSLRVLLRKDSNGLGMIYGIIIIVIITSSSSSSNRIESNRIDAAPNNRRETPNAGCFQLGKRGTLGHLRHPMVFSCRDFRSQRFAKVPWSWSITRNDKKLRKVMFGLFVD